MTSCSPCSWSRVNRFSASLCVTLPSLKARVGFSFEQSCSHFISPKITGGSVLRRYVIWSFIFIASRLTQLLNCWWNLDSVPHGVKGSCVSEKKICLGLCQVTFIIFYFFFFWLTWPCGGLTRIAFYRTTILYPPGEHFIPDLATNDLKYFYDLNNSL